MRWIGLYWFGHVIRTHASMIAARLALLKAEGDILFLCCRDCFWAILQHREVPDVVIQYCLLYVIPLPFGHIGSEDCKVT
jgi:hypothetical protein